MFHPPISSGGDVFADPQRLNGGVRMISDCSGDTDDDDSNRVDEGKMKTVTI